MEHPPRLPDVLDRYGDENVTSSSPQVDMASCLLYKLLVSPWRGGGLDSVLDVRKSLLHEGMDKARLIFWSFTYKRMLRSAIQTAIAIYLLQIVFFAQFPSIRLFDIGLQPSTFHHEVAVGSEDPV